MIGFDFLDEVSDPKGAPEETSNDPDLPEEDETEEAGDEGVQDEPTDEEESDEAEDDEELEVIDLDGEEVTLDQIREWKRGTLREQDYTKKTTALSEDRKNLEAKMSQVDELASVLAESESDLKALLVSDLDDIDMKQLRIDDYPEYARLKEERAEREAKIDEIKSKIVEAKEQLISEQTAELVKDLGWDDSVKQQADIDAFSNLAKELGMSKRDASTITSAKVMKALIELANIKKTSSTKPPAAKRKKVKIGKRSPSAPSKKPKTAVDRINSFFD